MRRHFYMPAHPYYSKAILISLGLDNFFSTIITARADMVAQMRLSGGRLYCQCGAGQEIVRTVHAALGGGLFILLNGHDNS